jgi:hypothetical protein
MGNSSTKEARAPGRSRPETPRHASSATATEASQATASTPVDRLLQDAYGISARPGRLGGRSTSRTDLTFFGFGDRSEAAAEQRRETKQEREAAKAEKERLAREKEREKSLLEEHVDGGYLVTLGTYTGPEDFNKSIVRQLQVMSRSLEHFL